MVVQQPHTARIRTQQRRAVTKEDERINWYPHGTCTSMHSRNWKSKLLRTQRQFHEFKFAAPNPSLFQFSNSVTTTRQRRADSEVCVRRSRCQRRAYSMHSMCIVHWFYSSYAQNTEINSTINTTHTMTDAATSAHYVITIILCRRQHSACCMRAPANTNEYVMSNKSVRRERIYKSCERWMWGKNGLRKIDWPHISRRWITASPFIDHLKCEWNSVNTWMGTLSLSERSASVR